MKNVNSLNHTQLKYLGYIVDRQGLRTDPSKVESMVNFPAPRNIKEVRRYIGMVSWYRRFLKDFSTVTNSITKLMCKSQKFVWTDEANAAFLQIKQMLVSVPILTCPDFSLPFTLQCDAS